MHTRAKNSRGGKRTRSYSAAGLFVLVAAFCSGCAAPSINVMKLEPGRSAEAASYKKVAVLPFEGRNGTFFASQLEGMLGSIKVDEKQFFEMVNRSAIDKVTEELKLAQSGLVDSSTAAKVGNIIGAKGIYIGHITSSVSDNDFVEGRSECTKYSSNGKKCLATREWNVSCVKRTAQFSATPKLVDVNTARVVFSENYSQKKESARCSDSAHALQGGSELLSQLRQNVIEMIRKDVAPFYVQVKIKLLAKDEALKSEAAKAQLKQGMAFAEDNRFDRACDIWLGAQNLAPDSVAFLHNLAVCAETRGNLEEADSLIKRADKQLTAPDQIVSESLSRISYALTAKEKLARQQGQ